ncbi:MAG TPA: glycosyltransferase, partial [Epsilonproteobacteria bacterium]|nr:glycosyltransferase [Campylobacterota bacterium]
MEGEVECEEKLPLVSVAIITYNQKEYLKECIESVLAQDYENIEIVIADDCSTDGTQDMLKEYDKKYPNKFVLKLSDKNQGITKNSNLAHFACSGKYIAWMGGDDLMLSGKIRKQVEYMEENQECTICYHNLDVFQSDTNETLYYFNKKTKYEGDVYTSIKYGTFNGACSTMIRASKAPKNGFNETIPVASDWLYWVETLHNGGTINYIDEVLGRYRRHDNNVTKKTSSITQNQIDHLNSCHIILSLYPEYSKVVFY